jgi:protein-disulfide isomerase
MASRAEQKQEARARRLAAEEAERRTARRRASLMRLGLVLALAVVVVIVAVVVSSGGNDEAPAGGGGGAKPGDAAAANALFRGIPQSGIHLGSGGGPTLIEFADLQCPFCAEYSNGVLPTVIKRYVRTGKVRYELRMRSFLGDDSVRAAGAAAAAASEDRLYQFADLFYRRQKEENTGYVTDDFIRSVASDSGVNPSKAVAAANDAKSQPLVAAAEQQAAALGSRGTPDFYLRLRGGRLVPVQLEALTPAAFTKALDQALSQK